MDRSKFMIRRPGQDRDANVQRSFYNSKGNARFITILAVVIPSGLRACVTFGTGRHADPFLLTPVLKNTLEFINLPVLGDSIFGKSQYIRGMEKLSRATLSATKSVDAAAIRIPIEWSFAEIKQTFPLTTTFTELKLFQTRPRAIIELACLLANFRICFRGGISSSYFEMRPPTFKDYINFEVEPQVPESTSDEI